MSKSKCIQKHLGFYEIIWRILVVVICGVFPVTVPLLGALINITGSFSMSILAYFLPPLINLATFWEQRLHSRTLKVILLGKDIFLVVLGLSIAIAATYASLVETAEEAEEEEIFEDDDD